MTHTWRDTFEVETLALVPPSEIDLKAKLPDVAIVLCRHMGPYFREIRGKFKSKYRQLLCTRPEGHDGNHQWASPTKGPECEWTAECEKLWQAWQ